MENEPEKPKSSVPPPPDIPSSPPPPSPPRGPDLPPPPPPMEAPPMSDPPPKPEPKPVPKEDFSSIPDDVPAVPGSEAKFDTRVVALLIDVGVAIGIYIIINQVFSPLATIVMLAYYLVRDALPFLDGQSVGKKVMKLRAVTLQNRNLTGDWKTSAVRNLPVVIPVFNLVEAYILYSKKDQNVPLRRFGDEWGKTKVVVAEQEAAAPEA